MKRSWLCIEEVRRLPAKFEIQPAFPRLRQEHVCSQIALYTYDTFSPPKGRTENALKNGDTEGT